MSSFFRQTLSGVDGVEEFSLGYDEQQALFKYKIYVTTFLGYGANKAFDKYIDQLISRAFK